VCNVQIVIEVLFYIGTYFPRKEAAYMFIDCEAKASTILFHLIAVSYKRELKVRLKALRHKSAKKRQATEETYQETFDYTRAYLGVNGSNQACTVDNVTEALEAALQNYGRIVFQSQPIVYSLIIRVLVRALLLFSEVIRGTPDSTKLLEDLVEMRNRKRCKPFEDILPEGGIATIRENR
jgi:hypothetical protein